MRRITLTLLIVFALGLTACGAPARTPSPTAESTTAPSGGESTSVPDTGGATAPVTDPTTEPVAATPTPPTEMLATVMPSAVPATLVPTVEPVAQAPTGLPAVSTPEPSAAVVVPPSITPQPPPPVAAPAGDARALAWNPNTQSLAWYTPDGTATAIAGAGSSRALAIPCAVNGDWLVYHLGAESDGTQALYNVITGQTIPLPDNHGAMCTVRGLIQFSPNGTRLGILSVAPDALRGQIVVRGKLLVLDIATGTSQTVTEDVTTFTLYDNGALLMRTFTNSDGETNAADLVWWDGSSLRAIEADVKPLEDCLFESLRTLWAGETVYSLLGERCQGRGTTWRVVRSDFGGGNSVNLAQGQAGGSYFPTVATNDLFMMPGGSELLIVVPNGLNLEIADLLRVNLANGAITSVLASVVVDKFPPANARRTLFSPDGGKLAAVRRDGNGGETLFILDLTSPDTAPAEIAGGNRSDRINAVAWAADSARLFFIVTGDTQALAYYDSGSRSERQIVQRGVYQSMVLRPDGGLVALTKENKAGTNDVRSNLVFVYPAENREQVVVEGQQGDAALVPLLAR